LRIRRRKRRRRRKEKRVKKIRMMNKKIMITTTKKNLKMIRKNRNTRIPNHTTAESPLKPLTTMLLQ
jgi:hypothetical protein